MWIMGALQIAILLKYKCTETLKNDSYAQVSEDNLRSRIAASGKVSSLVVRQRTHTPIAGPNPGTEPFKRSAPERPVWIRPPPPFPIPDRQSGTGVCHRRGRAH
jgi:hypothetical protein